MSYVKKNFLSIPVRMYESYSLMTAVMEEEKAFSENKVLEATAVDYAAGRKLIKPETIVSWSDCWSRERKIGDVIDHGFDSTLIMFVENDELHSVESTWKRVKFETELDKWYEDNQKSELI